MIALGIVLLLAVGGFVVWLTSWRPQITIGRPTPEDARVKVDAADAKARAATNAKINEVRDATNEERLRRARDRVRRGLRPE